MRSQVGLRKNHYELAFSGGDGIPVELFQSAIFNIPANLENSAVATGPENVFSFQSQRKAMPKNAQTTT